MARDYGQIQHRIWADPDWRALEADAQLLYLLLLSQPSMNQAGVLPLQLRKWSGCVAGWTTATVDEALHELADARFVVLDEDTEEVLVRSFIRNDGSYKIPGVLKSALKFAAAVQSQAIRTALAAELGRLPALEGKTAADGMQAIATTRFVLEPIRDPFPDPIKEPIPEPIGDPYVSNPSGIPSTEPIADPIGEPPLSGSGSVSLLALVRSEGGERSSPAPEDEAPKCPKHQGMDRDDIPPCRACGRLRTEWEAAVAESRRAAAAEAAKPKPMCRKHPGQIATHCGPCRSEQIGVA
jgi:hypothetical protein